MELKGRLEQQAKKIVDMLHEHRFEAYFVGGFVRDRLLGRPIKDIDIATSAKPDEVIALFERCEPTGLQHGTVTVILSGAAFEVTTFRSETAYEDYRRPGQVHFIENIVADLSRRDFTMNAMAMDREGVIIDPFGGQKDLGEGILRCVGDPITRFGEDALRMLRCIRFAAEYDLKIADSTWRALLKHSPSLEHIALERVRAELERIIEGSHPGRGFVLLKESGMLRYLKSDIGIDLEFVFKMDHAHISSLFRRIEEASVRWALLFLLANTSPEKVSKSLRILAFANQKSKVIIDILSFHEWLLEQLLMLPEADRSAELKAIWKLGAVRYDRMILKFWLKLIDSANRIILVKPLVEATTNLLAYGEQWLSDLPAANLHELQVKGRDLLSIGCKSGPVIGRLLQELLRDVALGKVDNNKAQLLIRAKQMQTGDVFMNDD